MKKIGEALLQEERRQYRYLNILRGAAVLAIVSRHSWGLFGSPRIEIAGINLDPFINQFSSAVDLFFVLSGVVLGLSYLRKRTTHSPVSDAKFLGARFLRIAPPYWVALILVIVLFTPGFIGREIVFSPDGLRRVLVFGTFLQQFDPVTFGSISVISPFWTLSVEMVFYLMLPLLMRMVQKLGPVISSTLAFAASSTWLVFVGYHSMFLQDAYASFLCVPFGVDCDPDFIKFILSHQIFSYLAHFVFGLSIASLSFRGLVITKKRAVVLASCGATLVLVWMWILGSTSIQNEFWNAFNYLKLIDLQSRMYFFGESLIYALGFALILFAVTLGPESAKGTLFGRFFVFYGRIGYSVYLLHMPLIYAFTTTDFFQILANLPLREISLTVSTLAFITSMSVIFYLGVEKVWHIKASQFSSSSKVGQ